MDETILNLLRLASYLFVATAAYFSGYLIGKTDKKEAPLGNLMIGEDEDGEFMYIEFPSKEALTAAKKKRRIVLDVIRVPPKEKQVL